ncbi:hypothetical protein ACOME3_004007 [Neoechinorhynchus agilis]
MGCTSDFIHCIHNKFLEKIVDDTSQCRSWLICDCYWPSNIGDCRNLLSSLIRIKIFYPPVYFLHVAHTNQPLTKTFNGQEYYSSLNEYWNKWLNHLDILIQDFHLC